MICGQKFKRLDIPAWWRKKEEEDKNTEETVSDGRQDEAERKESECCGARMLGGIQCEACGSDGKFKGCEKCGGELKVVSLGDETYNRCVECGHYNY